MITIRPERPGDDDAIRHVVAAAFGSDVEADLVERIRSSPEYEPELALVAVDDAETEPTVVGHAMISRAELRRAHGVAPASIVMLSPLAVAPDRQRQGIGDRLVRTAVAAADGRGEPLVVVEGDPSYYGRFGFEPASRHGVVLPLPDWAPDEAGQVLRLARYDPDLIGSVVYPAAFDGVE